MLTAAVIIAVFVLIGQSVLLLILLKAVKQHFREQQILQEQMVYQLVNLREEWKDKQQI
ncbi:hypothetical protein [Alkalicoccus luteus]|uniref:Uncharacterized protein n=1 Tax=Alkalicoccus luteus TaxID=1237094 RepID=A0A969PU68_9BACI|nr:hypothetical protein [Alkalicoccus luteus]NJP38461.1 hypothetical protein [Alkalicoccus luteus]